jgi:hypothetical protein
MNLTSRIERLEGQVESTVSGRMPTTMPLEVFRRCIDETLSEEELEYWRPLIEQMLAGLEREPRSELN